MKRRTFRLLTPLLLTLASVLALSIAAAAQGQKPLREAEILKELAGGTSNQRLAALVRESGVDFSLTPESEGRPGKCLEVPCLFRPRSFRIQPGT